ncbi:haloacid dehalogenase [Paenibacillus baekrokdamisoli]|uniref:Haloacid dehalogenase n=1 Tax=Paenibacillus baekrokdamisoli TaxID=1712516 RepID=A0A3G9INM9_9BACL|nr:HAD hydrolase-like protein [Paenibacillus baekrokdamisoli]MBB3070575.1 putative hydrolase of the HAD superfamily [Paenibacillus baekrokdamisoli]BBH19926.1 haloacid dehalogenase [Paenibacillus baekrokdamisoli]
MNQRILFDLDDTLIYCNKYFTLVIDQFTELMSDWFIGHNISVEMIRDKQTEIDIAGVHVVGFQSDHFPQSFIDTYRYFSDLVDRAISVVEEDLLWKLGRSVYEHEVEPYPFMEETLDRLATSGHELHLYTGGELLIQQRKIDQMQLERYFESRIYVRSHKNIEAMETILREGGFDRNATWMIGNSLRTDVIPALTSGIHAIHLKTESEWIYNIVGIDVEPKGAFLTLDQLSDVPGSIENYILQRQSSLH